MGSAREVIFIDNGTSFEAYEIYIDNGSGWDRYAAYIDNGSGWDLCGEIYITYLYSSGDECTNITGGWEIAKTSAGSITKNSDHVDLSLIGIPGGASYGVINTVNAIDLTNIKQLTINSDWIVSEDNGDYRPIFGVSTSKPRGAASMRDGAKTTQGPTLDVSTLSGNYYVYVGSPMIPGNKYDVTLKVTEVGME